MNHDFRPAFVELDFARDGDLIASQRFQEFLSSLAGGGASSDEETESSVLKAHQKLLEKRSKAKK